MGQLPTRRVTQIAIWLFGAFVALNVLVLIVGVGSWEIDATRWVHQWPDWFAIFLRPAMEFGNRLVATLVAVIVAVQVGRPAGSRVFAAGVVAWLTAISVKSVVRRPRIDTEALGETPRHIVDGWSFPSGHTSIAWAIAVAVIVVARPPRWLGAFLVGIATLTGVARMYVGVHMPLDVLGGMFLGSGAALAITSRSS